MMDKGLIVLIDCHALLYRGHFAMMRNPLRAADGTNTSGLFYLVREILDWKDTRSPELILAVFDYPAPTFRSKIFPDYKANRPPMPDDLRKQSELARRLIPAIGVPLLEKQGFEADDIIAWLSVEASSRGNSVEIMSSDKDLLQLVTESVKVIRPGRGSGQNEIVGRDEVPGIIGVRPDQVSDFLALTGDSSDNIPGARGIGAKTASKLLEQYGSIADIYGSLDEISGSVRGKLEKGRETVMMSRELTSLVPPRDVGISLDRLSMLPVDATVASGILTSMGMDSVLERLGLENKQDLFGSLPAGPSKEYCRTSIVGSIDSLREIDLSVTEDGRIAIDTETTSKRPFSAEPVGLSIAAREDSAWYVPLCGDGAMDAREVASALDELTEGYGIVAQNGKYDMHVLQLMGMGLKVLSGDPMIADYLLRPEIQSHSLSSLSMRWLGRRMDDYGSVLGNAGTLAEVETRKVADYCGCDSTTALSLCRMLERELEKDSSLLEIYRTVEMPLVGIIAAMEARGVGLDLDSLHQLEMDFSADMRKLEIEAADTAGFRINLNSPAQVSKVLFEDLGLAPVSKTSTGANSSSMEVLEKLRGQHDFVETVIQHRELSKLLNTYVMKLPDYVCGRDGLLHTSFSQTVAATGRLSSSNPNLQNIPIRTGRGRLVRKCFVPGGNGNVFVTADYSQIELRILAHFAGPGNLRKAYEDGADIHSATALAVFGDSSPEHRRKAKEVNFSILYGISPWGLSNRLNVSRGEASGIIDRYLGTYPELKTYFQKCVEYVDEHGETRTILGRKREFSGFRKARGTSRSAMERMAVNTTIQGSAADIIKLAMIRVDNRLKEMPGSGLVLQVHDELVAIAPEGMASEVASILKEEMESACALEVPLTVDTGIGDNWMSAQH